MLSHVIVSGSAVRSMLAGFSLGTLIGESPAGTLGQ